MLSLEHSAILFNILSYHSYNHFSLGYRSIFAIFCSTTSMIYFSKLFTSVIVSGWCNQVGIQSVFEDVRL